MRVAPVSYQEKAAAWGSEGHVLDTLAGLRIAAAPNTIDQQEARHATPGSWLHNRFLLS